MNGVRENQSLESEGAIRGHEEKTREKRAKMGLIVHFLAAGMAKSAAQCSALRKYKISMSAEDRAELARAEGI